MNITVEYIDQNGTVTNMVHKLTKLAFVKHLAIAGQGYAPTPKKLIRTIAMLFHYSYYLQGKAFNSDKFSEPPIEFSDPTEKSQFSNLAGKALADYLSKRIDKSTFTVNYEAAMRIKKMPINVQRPDLLAFKKSGMFALEAKGYSGGHGNMAVHKLQSQTGGIPVNFTVACVSYNIYNKIKCKYHDPYNENIPFDNELFQQLTRRYYKGLSGFLNEKYFSFQEVQFQNENFYEIELSYRQFEELFPNFFPHRHFWYFEFLKIYRPRLILPKQIIDYAENGVTNETRSFLFESIQESQYIYVDNDRVGLRIG